MAASEPKSRVFSSLEHAAQPIEGGVGVGISDGFVQSGDEVKVFLAGFVVDEDALLEGLGGDFAGDHLAGGAGGEFGGNFKGVEGVAGVAGGVRGEEFEGVAGRGEMLGA